MPGSSFDFPAFKAADEAKDASTWLGFHAEDAEWIGYRHLDPPSRPSRPAGRAEIGEFPDRIAAGPITLAIEGEVLGGDRIAFRSWVGLPEGRRIVEHVMLEIAEGRISRQIDVEAWD